MFAKESKCVPVDITPKPKLSTAELYQPDITDLYQTKLRHTPVARAFWIGSSNKPRAIATKLNMDASREVMVQT